ncbi:efflux RND transporter permease subunit [Spirochaeta lutea]|uniref:Acriflavin resistance protein n=1 Tax=Spirochaeta lutea TaxID=1480694 RepID=A0A098QWL4_9SPIO|nr:efflux RND transporter permease subunit [Spirochaeta lutea]KGE71951.1 hypothetical protein DC28_09150 [Spirochaeta lutea]
MSIPSLSVKHPVTAAMVFSGFFILGLLSLTRIGQELFPDVEFPTIVAVTVSPGVGPREVEAQISIPIEGAVAGLSGVESISSTSLDSASQVVVGFASGTDLTLAVTEVREALTAVEGQFPEGTERPQLFRFSANQLPSLRLNLYTKTPGINIRSLAEDAIVPQLERIPGVAQVSLFGGKEEAVLVELDLDSLNKLAIPVTQVMQVFQGENVSLPGGTIRLDDQTIILRTTGEFLSLNDIGNVLVGTAGNSPVFLSDIASITLGYKPQEEYLNTGGYEGLRLNIQKQSGYNTVQVNEAVLEKLDDLKKNLPPSIEIEIQEDQAVQVRASIGGVADSAWQGGLLAILVLLFFLRNIRSTIIISMVIPVSVIATFSLIDFGGMTLNITSLLGITLAIGMFVDNAIVVLESIYRKQLQGLSPHDAAIEGAEEVSQAITASTLTSMAVFLPMLFVEGLAGALFQDLSLTISFSLAVSLIAALGMIPVLCSRFLHVGKVSLTQRQKAEGEHHELSLADVEVISKNRIITALSGTIQKILQWLDAGYERLISTAIRNPGWVFGSALVLLGLSLGSIFLLGMEFLPEADEGSFQVTIETRVGSPHDFTAGKVASIEQIIRAEAGEYIETMASRVGEGGSHFGAISVKLLDKDKRPVDIWELTNAINRRVSEEVMDIKHSIEILGMASLAGMASGTGNTPIAMELSGDSIDAMYDYGSRIVGAMEKIPGIRSPRLDYSLGKPELQFKIRRREAVSLGLNPLQIAGTIRTAYNGYTATTFTADGQDYDVLLLLREADRNDVERIREITFYNQAGSAIPLENVVELVEDQGPVSIQRKDRVRVISAVAGTTGERPLNRITEDVEQAIADLGPPPVGVSLSIEGASAEMTSSFESLFFALILAVMLVYMVMASQFESLVKPIIVMFSVPFAIIGLTAALLITNTTFNILSFTGAILLVGIVVNNAIVLLDYMSVLQQRGVPLEQAIIQGGRTRLKPILMTTTTTILGLFPMSLGFGIGSELRAPMARAVVGGLTTSTLITLVLIPTIYWLVEARIKPWIRRHSNHPIQEGDNP